MIWYDIRCDTIQYANIQSALKDGNVGSMVCRKSTMKSAYRTYMYLQLIADQSSRGNRELVNW